VAKLHKKDFKSPDKQPRMYNLQLFRVHGRIEVDVSFGDHTMKTPIYIKMDAPEQLLFSEGICHQLGIIRYYPDVKPGNATEKTSAVGDCKVPMVRVKLVQDIRLLPNQHFMAEVTLQREEVGESCEPPLFKPDALLAREKIQALETVLPNDEKLYVPILNQLGFTQRMDSRVQIRTAQPVEVTKAKESKAESTLEAGTWE